MYSGTSIPKTPSTNSNCRLKYPFNHNNNVLRSGSSSCKTL